MCGFLVEIRRGDPIDRARFQTALKGLVHRGPDSEGVLFHTVASKTADAPNLHVAMGFRRLAILDLDARADQPFHLGDRHLVYNGEIYNFRALAQTLSATGASFATSGDTEVLATLLQQQGIAGLQHANGMWAFCEWDLSRHVLTAARDRYGKKPLFYYQDADTLCLASEIAPILTLLGQRARLKSAAVSAYLASGWVFPSADGQTHIEGIREVRPGTALTFDLASWQTTETILFDIRQSVLSASPDREALPEILQDAVLSRLVSDRPVGLMLSGGVDSSLILSILAATGRLDQVHTFSGDAGRSEDADYARRSIAALGVTAKIVHLDYGRASLDGFLATCRRQEKPFPFIGNALSAPQLYAAIADAGVPVVLDGAGADEIFAGYWERTFAFAVAEAVTQGDHAWLSASRAANADQPHLIAIIDQVTTAVLAGRFGATEHWPAVTSSGLAADLARFAPGLIPPMPHDPLARCGPSLTDALIRDAAPGGRLGEWLWQNDRNAMAASLENRSPFLDYRLLAYMATPYGEKFTGPWNKYELRPLFDRFRPLEVQWRRHKQGFRWHYTPFVRNNRHALLDMVRSSALLAPIVDLAGVIDWAIADDDHMLGDLMQRLIGLAGLERGMGLAV
jgi:asparagine synthase (glutamine-hydrolysing)